MCQTCQIGPLHQGFARYCLMMGKRCRLLSAELVQHRRHRRAGPIAVGHVIRYVAKRCHRHVVGGGGQNQRLPGPQAVRAQQRRLSGTDFGAEFMQVLTNKS